MNCKIQAFPVRNGDCLLISLSNNEISQSPTHLLVDTGYADTYLRTLKPALKQLLALDQQIKLFVMTHIDGDHIGGVKQLLADFGNEWFEQAWFNYSPKPYTLPPDSGESSVRQGIILRDFLLAEQKVNVEPILSNHRYTIGSAKLYILSPDEAQFVELIDEWRKEEEELIASTDNPSSSIESDHDDTIEDLFKKPFHPDNSLTNRSSIVFTLTVDNLTALFTGDAHTDVICQSLRKARYTPEKPLCLQFMKIAHHGSKGNTSRDLMELIDCRHYLISTNAANKHQFPHKEALARVVEAAHNRNPGEPVHFYFTYADTILENLFSASEKQTYQIICHFPEEGDSGITFSF